MSWRGLLILGPLWTLACAAMSTSGPVWGAAVGGGFWLLIVVMRASLERADNYGPFYRGKHRASEASR